MMKLPVLINVVFAAFIFLIFLDICHSRWGDVEFEFEACETKDLYDTKFINDGSAPAFVNEVSCSQTIYDDNGNMQSDEDRFSLSSWLYFLLGIMHGKRIAGGSIAKNLSVPWMALLGTKTSPRCGGVLISKQWVLTAAHCFLDLDEDKNILSDCCNAAPCEWNVRLGEQNLIDSDDRRRDFTPEDLIIHPDYDPDLHVHDIAMIKLPQPIELNQGINAICIPDADYKPHFGEQCEASGWGASDGTGDASTTKDLMEISIPIEDSTFCKLLYEDHYDLDTMICAGDMAGFKDTCPGDSGGPLMCSNGGQTVLAGIVSYGVVNCSSMGKPGVYTDVASHREWINSVMNNY